MIQRKRHEGLLLAGAAHRFAIALVLIALVWAGFFWATGLPLPFIGGAA